MPRSRAAEDVAQRAGAQVSLGLESGLDASPATRDALRRIVREAVCNAVRHGKAGSVHVSATRSDGRLRVRVIDDGVGFDPTRSGHGFGLTAMRERARALGGEVTVTSRPGAGTEIEVVVP